MLDLESIYRNQGALSIYKVAFDKALFRSFRGEPVTIHKILAKIQMHERGGRGN